ncbi:MAG TPA: MFS transporter [Polyangiaceae bacterium]|nr:MFS transporter [Polyangiaceae bacterium]
MLRLLDVRPAEARSVLAAFGSLFFIVVAHTMLETARDAMFLVHVGPGALGYMYIVAAALTLAVGALSARLGERVGARRALVGAQLGSAAGAAVFFFLPPTAPVLTALYAFSAVSGALLVPQLWAAAAALFHAGQGRRLFGTIATAGVLGGVLGSAAGAGALLVVDLHWLLLASAGAYVASSGLIGLAPRARGRLAPGPAGPAGTWWGAFREEPALARVALVVGLGAVTTLLADYLFKSVAAANVEPARLGTFLARSYAAMNVLALAVQVLGARRVLARAGVIGTVGLMPSLMFLGGVLGFVTGGALFAVFGTRAADGALRHSVQRTGLELVYLAVPASARNRARPVIEGALTRLAQAATAGLVLLFAAPGRVSARELAFIVAASAAAWLAAVAALRGPYVALFRRALLGPGGAEPRSAEELDLASVEILIEALSSPQPREAIAALRALERRGRAGLVPGLVLLRDEDEVLECALELFGSSTRSDWVHLAERRLADQRERVRRAAMRALARARHVAGGGAREGGGAVAERPWIRGYLAVDDLSGAPDGAPAGAEIAALLTPDADGREARLGMLRALADVAPSPRLAALLAEIVEGAAPGPLDKEALGLAARAAENLRAAALAPWFVERLGHREGRAAARSALAALGEPAFELLAGALARPESPRLFRAQLPLAIAEFRTQRAADLLFGFAARGDDGLVRYRCLLALERMALDHVARFRVRDVRPLVRRELGEYFRLVSLRVALRGAPSASAAPAAAGDALELLLRVLDDKRGQAFERAIRLLQLCFPDEDFRRVEAAIASGDPVQRANAAEFLDALLAQRRRGNEEVRMLLRLSIEELPDADRVARAEAVAPLGGPDLGAGPGAALAALGAGRDAGLAALARAVEEEARAGGRATEWARSAPRPEAPLSGLLPPAEAHGR